MPSWTFSAIIAGVLYLFWARLIVYAQKQAATDSPFMRVEKFLSVIDTTKFFGIWFAIFGAGGIILYGLRVEVIYLACLEIFLGVLLCAAIFVGAITTAQLLRVDTGLRKNIRPAPTDAQDGILPNANSMS